MPRRRSVHIPPQNDSNRKFFAGLLVLSVLVAVGAYFLARSDKGAIDVTAAIMNANTIGGDTETSVGAPTNAAVIPTTFSNMPNGGLVPSDPSTQQSEPEPVPKEVETATTSSELGDIISSESDAETTNVEESGAQPETNATE